MTPDGRALALAARQGGVLTRAQALDCGLSAGAVQHRLSRGAWQRVLRSVYRIIDMTETKDLVRAAVAALPGAVASHETAAEMHGVPHVERGLAVVTVHTRTTHFFAGVTVHRAHDLLGDHVERIGELLVTTLPRTVVDLGQILHPKHLRRVVDDLIAQQRLSVAHLQSVHDEVARRGKPGSTAIRAILLERADGVEASASRLELEGLSVLRSRGIPDPVLEFPMPWDPNRRFDAGYPDARLAIEWDSRRWHGHLDSFERDRERDREAQVHGWRILRFTWKDVTERPEMVAQTVGALLHAPNDANRGL